MDFFQKIKTRLESSKSDSDVAYFYDLLLFGEFTTKIVALYLTSAINEDSERTRYRQEYNLVRANAVGDFAKSIDDILTGPSAQLLSSTIRDYELKELTQRSSAFDWQYRAQSKLYDCFSVFNIEIDPLPMKSPLRNWFGVFSYFRNKTRGHGAPKVEHCSEAVLSLFEAISLITDNFTAFKRPWVYLHQNLNGKYRISTISPQVSNDFDYLKKESIYNFSNGIYYFLDKVRKVNLMYTNPELSDYFVSNGNLKANHFEAISYVTDERIQCDAQEYLFPISKLPSSQTEGLNEINVEGNAFTNLPRISDEYISRKYLEEELQRVLLEEDRFPIVTLLGSGGIGKTSLALNVVKEISTLERYSLVVWFSARDIDLLMDGPKQVQTKVLNQKDISTEFCSLVYPEKEIKDKVDFFSREMTASSFGKALYVFDNFETLTNPLEIFEWINTFIRNPNKVLITSRISRNFKADYPIEIRGMSDIESRMLVSLFSKKLNIDSLINSTYVDEILSESEGHPYIIKILLGEVAKSNRLIKIERIVAEQDKILTALFKRTFNTLSPAAKRVFLTLCSWNSMIPTIALEAVLWRPENEKIDVTGAIEDLRKSSFIDVIDVSDESLINVPLAAAVFGKSELEVYPEKIKILDDRRLLMEFGAISQGNVSSVVASRVERKFRSVANRVTSISDFRKELPTLEYIASKFPKAYQYIIEVFEEFREYEDVKYYLREYLKTPLLPKDKADLWLRLADICRFTKDWDGESHAISELAIVPGISFSHISEAANRINNYFYFHPEARVVEYKKAFLDRVIGIMKKRINEGTATDYSRLGWLLLSNDQEEEARVMVQKGIEMDPDNHHCEKLYNSLNIQ